jgi:hypothetical protein
MIVNHNKIRRLMRDLGLSRESIGAISPPTDSKPGLGQ